MSPSETAVRSIEDLPAFDEWDAPDWGHDVDGLAIRIFSRPYQGPLRGSDGSLVIYRNSDCRALRSTPHSTHQSLEAMTEYWRDADAEPRGLLNAWQDFTLRAPRHMPWKELSSRRLTTQSMARYLPDAREAAREALQRVADGSEIDFVHDLTQPLAAGFWSRVLGLTAEEATRALQAGADTVKAMGISPTAADIAAADGGMTRYMETVSQALRRGMAAGDRPLLNELKADYDQSDPELRPSDPCAAFATVLSDGFYSFGAALGGIMYALLTDDDSLARVKADPSLIPSAAMEGLRLHPAAILSMREAADDFVYDGVAVPQGTALSMMWLLGNRDPEVFENPNGFVLERDNRIKQIQFGGGVYMCPGRNVVRMLAEAAMAVLVEPSVEIDIVGPPQWMLTSVVHELSALPVRVRVSA